jgi:phosphoribosyl 1,2-cyclic phosphodiesterase
MRIRFWGTRGSIATPGPQTLGYGGNTSCVEVRAGDQILIFDAGTGIRELGVALMHEAQAAPLTLHLFISHTHWDHIQGLPFFLPAYQANATIHVYGSPGQGRSLEKVLRGQMDADYFPVALGDMASTMRVHEYRAASWQLGDVAIDAMYLNHPGMNLGYRVRHGGKTLIYATDHEPYRHTLDQVARRAEAGREFGGRLDEEFVRFVAGADLYIGEAQYTDEEYTAKVGWGHSSLSATVEVALKAQVRRLALFHHDPMHADDVITAMVEVAQRLIAAQLSPLQCFAAREGQIVDLSA